MKRLIAAALLAAPMANANASICIFGFCFFTRPPSAPAPAPRPASPPSSSPVAAPEIDAAAGTLAIALAGGGMALLARSRRRKDVIG